MKSPNPAQVVWVVRAGKGDLSAAGFEQAGLAGLALPDVPSVRGMSRKQVIDTLRAVIPYSPGRAQSYGAVLYRFMHEISIGDRVVTPDSVRRELLCGTFVSDYFFDAPVVLPDFRHFRRVEWLGRTPWAEVQSQALRSVSAPSAVFHPAAQSLLLELPVWRLEAGCTLNPAKPRLDA